LEREVQEALTSRDLRDKLRVQDILVEWTGSADTKTRIAADAKLWAKVVKATGMHVD
jgi:tripartite-type tricarboxylate transporter receptor subunit TctC